MNDPYDLPEKWLSHPDTSVLLPEDRSLPVRPRDSHKGDYGKVLILGGAVGYTGAVSMCAHAAVRSGAGLVSVGVPETIWPILAVKQDVAMPFPADTFRDVSEKLTRCDVCVIGPGMGRDRARRQLVRDVLEAVTVPTVADADALFALSRDMGILKRTKAPLILTPHAGEFTRMGGVLTDDRAADARHFVSAHGCTLVLKGHRTVIAFPAGAAPAARGRPHRDMRSCRGGRPVRKRTGRIRHDPHRHDPCPPGSDKIHDRKVTNIEAEHSDFRTDDDLRPPGRLRRSDAAGAL